MDAHFVREFRPRKVLDLEDVVQKLCELVRAFAHGLHFLGLLDSCQMRPDLMDAASRRTHYIIVTREILYEESFGRRRLGVTARVRHRLPTAGLVERIFDLASEPFQ